MATLGYTHTTGNNYSVASGRHLGAFITVGASSIDVDDINVYFNTAPTNIKFFIAEVTTTFASSYEVTYINVTSSQTAGSSGAYTTYTYPTKPTLSASTSYIIGYIADTTSDVELDTTTSGKVRIFDNDATFTDPTTDTTLTSFTDAPSVYISYTPASSDVTINPTAGNLVFSGTDPTFVNIIEEVYNPDADPETTSVDGRVGRTSVNETFATIKAGAGTDHLDNNPAAISAYLEASTTSSQFAFMYRGIILFDTSALPDDAEISSATLSLYGQSKSNALGSPDIHIVASSPASNTDLVNADYSTLSFTSFSSISYASWSTSAYNDFALNSSGISNISKTGVSKFGFTTSWDVNGSFTGSWSSSAATNIEAKAAESGASTAPKLTINYTSGEIVTVTAGRLVSAGTDPTISNIVNPTAGNLVISGADPSIVNSVSPTAGTLTFSGSDPTLVIPASISPSPATMSFSGASPTVVIPFTSTQSGEILTVSGSNPSVITGSLVEVSAGTINIVGTDPNIQFGVTNDIASATLNFSGTDPSVATENNDELISVGSANLVSKGYDPQVVEGFLSDECYQKTYLYKVYDSNDAIVSVWADDVISTPSWVSNINGCAGELRVTLAREFQDYGEGVDVKLGNKVDLYCYDKETPNGSIIYRGFISSYQPILRSGNETIGVVLLPLFQKTSNHILVNSSSQTTVVYNSYDPSDIFRDVFAKWIDDGATYVELGSDNWDSATWDDPDVFWDVQRPFDIDNTSTTVSYTFNTNTVKEAFDKSIELTPANWFYSVRADGTLVVKEKASTENHDLFIGKDIKEIDYQQRSENLVNEVYFVGSNLYKKYSRSGSIGQYGKYAKKVIDGRVSSADTANTIATKILDEQELPETRVYLTVADSNGDGAHGYDIESINVGDTITVKNISSAVKTTFSWDTAKWDDASWDFTLGSVIAEPLTVVKTTYYDNMIVVETSSRFPQVSKRIEDINRNQENSITKDNPTQPT